MSRSLHSTWARLGIAQTADSGTIRRAYADRLRAMDVDADVEGFSALRAARDAALAWARQQPAAEPAPPPVVPDDDGEAVVLPWAWPYAAPMLDASGEGTLVASPVSDAAPLALVGRLAVGPASGAADPQFSVARLVFGVPLLPGGVARAAADSRFSSHDTVQLPTAVRPDHALHALLLEEADSEIGLTVAEVAQGQAHVAMLLDVAEGGAVDQWRRTEEWLAETLARGWPRSAPLLDAAAVAFGWAGRGATTSDTPAIAFLVPRVRTQPFTRSRDDATGALDVLLLDGDGPLDVESEARARDLLDQLVAEADAGSIEAHGATEAHIADLLAEAWPRSAPLLEPAAQAFGWTREAGQLHERATVAFLNARLAGMRFVDAVRKKGHPLHAAWKELTRGGSRKGLFAPNRQVHELLDGVRTRFPEVEQYLNSSIVARWDEPVGGGNFWRLPWVLIGLIAFRLLMVSFDTTPPSVPATWQSETESIAQPPAPLTDPASDNALRHAIAGAFGPTVDFADVRRADANLAETLAANRRQTDDPAALAAKVKVVVRQRLAMALMAGTPGRMDELARWRLAQLQAARKDGADTCDAMLRGNDLPATAALPADTLRQEQSLALSMLQGGQIDPPRPRPGTRTFSIPGLLIKRIIEATGLSRAQVDAALVNKGPSGTVCAVRIQLLKEALRWQGSERGAILGAV